VQRKEAYGDHENGLSLLETILIFVYVLGSLSPLVYFLHSLTILIYSQRPDFTAQSELFL